MISVLSRTLLSIIATLRSRPTKASQLPLGSDSDHRACLLQIPAFGISLFGYGHLFVFCASSRCGKDRHRTAGVTWGPKNAPFQTVEELQQVLGMTEPLYERVYPYFTIYALTAAVDPTVAGEKLTGILRKAGFDPQYFVLSSGVAYSIRAEAKASSGAIFEREVVIQLTPEQGKPIQIMSWRESP
jgi:Type II secretion system (T2SS), protein K